MKNGCMVSVYLLLATLVLLIPVVVYVGGTYMVLHFVRKFW